jgi:hypothetical protein
MAKKLKEPGDSSSLRQAIATFANQTDRGCAVIAAAWVDDALEQYLRAFLRPDQKTADEILQAEGPLGSFLQAISTSQLQLRTRR